jgi:2,4-dienoyl-CoA reductase-like NADH-dependent reductase (Old Yellow Enzyme family)
VCLKDSLQVKKVEFPNRIVFPPIQTRLATGDGAVTDDILEHYVRRSKGLGLLIVEHGYVSHQGRMGRKSKSWWRSNQKRSDGKATSLSVTHERSEGTHL